MKSDSRKPQVSESRRIRKPLMEKKRRARINDSLESLKQILLESKTNVKECKSGQRTAKLEKADILEMTVRYLQQLQGKVKENQTTKKGDTAAVSADSSCEIRTGITLLPTQLDTGEIVYFLPNKLCVRPNCEKFAGNRDQVWRPW